MADRVTDEMEQRVHHSFDDDFVYFRILAFDMDLDAFVQLSFQSTHHETHLLEHLSDRNHSDANDTLAQLSKLPFHASIDFLKRAPIVRAVRHCAENFVKPEAADDQFPDDSHQIVEPVHLNTNHVDRRNPGCLRIRRLVFDRRRHCRIFYGK